jgi:SAM-dependent methyltransferase
MNPHGDYQALDIIHQLPEKKFDLGILMEVFEHIHPDMADTFVQSIKKILNEKAVLYVTVPHANKPVEYKHYRHFTVASLTACFAPHFTPVEIVPFEKGKTRKGIIDFWLGNRFFILNIGRIRTALYKYYKKNLFIAEEKNCNRLLVKFVRND